MTKRKTIYLNDALEAIRKLPNAGIHWFVSVEAVFNALLKLPSAQPETEERMSETEQNVLNGELISKKAAIDALSNMMDIDGFRDGWAVSRANVNSMLRSLPSAQRKGKWIKEREEWFTDYPYKCTNCGKYSRARYHFCPNCGADMREGAEQDETD